MVQRVHLILLIRQGNITKFHITIQIYKMMVMKLNLFSGIFKYSVSFYYYCNKPPDCVCLYSSL